MLNANSTRSLLTYFTQALVLKHRARLLPQRSSERSFMIGIQTCQLPERPDFHGISNKTIYAPLKKNDSAAAATLLKGNPLFRKPFKMLDVGGADGWMAFELLRALQIYAPQVSAHSYLNETNSDGRIDKYRQRANSSLGLLTVADEVIQTQIEKVPVHLFPRVDLVLLSHLLYYNYSSWSLDPKNPRLDAHLLTKLISSLNDGGVICVVIQSAETVIQNKAGNCQLTHEGWEHHIYPLVEHVTHGLNKYYANARMFEVALNQYQELFLRYSNNELPWQIQSTETTTYISLEQVNLRSNNAGQYKQPPEANELFKFYLKNRDFVGLTHQQQTTVIGLLKDFCRSASGTPQIAHVNRIYTITSKKGLQQELQAAIANEQNNRVCKPG